MRSNFYLVVEKKHSKKIWLAKKKGGNSSTSREDKAQWIIHWLKTHTLLMNSEMKWKFLI